MSEVPDGTLRFRLERLESEQERQRDRTHDLDGAVNELRLALQRNSDETSHNTEEVKALKRAFYTFALGAVGSSVVFAFTVFALLGHS